MTDQITVPRTTWDAMREALEELADLVEASLKGEYEADSFTTQPARTALTAAASASNAVSDHVPETNFGNIMQPQEQGEAYSERWYGSGEDRGWWIVRGGLVKREHVAFLGESVAPEEVSKVVAELNIAHPQATEPAGYKLVPVEPTPAMLYAIQNDCDILPPRGKRIWTAMLAAAPKQPTNTVQE